MPDRSPTFDELLGRVFDEMRGSLRKHLSPADYAVLRDNFVFHMTDWDKDLKGLASLSIDPRSKDADEATAFLVGFLYDVAPHLQAAAKLLLGEIGDPFAGDELYELLPKPAKSDTNA